MVLLDIKMFACRHDIELYANIIQTFRAEYTYFSGCASDTKNRFSPYWLQNSGCSRQLNYFSLVSGWD